MDWTYRLVMEVGMLPGTLCRGGTWLEQSGKHEVCRGVTIAATNAKASSIPLPRIPENGLGPRRMR